MQRKWLIADTWTCCMTVGVHVALVVARRSVLQPLERAWFLGTAALAAAGLITQISRPRAYARCRLAFVFVLRAALLLGLPHAVDGLRILCNGGCATPDPAAAPAALAALHRAALLARAAALLVVGVCWLQACLGASTGFQLPPALHLALHGAAVARFCFRAPDACALYIEAHPSHRQLTAALYWVLRQAASVVLLGTREHLAAAAERASDVDKCTAVVWSLEASIAFALPTLLAWRAQVQLARQLTAARRAAAAPSPPSASASSDSAGGAQELRRSQYEWLAARVVKAADAYGGPVLPTAFAALVGWGAAVMWRAAPGVACPSA